LRSDLGFDGLVVTDEPAMAGAAGGGMPAEAEVRAVEAGADLLIISGPSELQVDDYDAVVSAVESGEIPRTGIRRSVGRLLALKETYDLRGEPWH
jgi:beta-N-acetylhexosaminidase